jgi:hypothetical protein
VALQATFLYGSVTLLRHQSSRRIQRRAMPPVMIGTVAITITPLIVA